ncbi:MAG: ECF transporter S component [Clostridiales bacterium]|nr:ECF transporter S component [Clostridiales bacterium]
MLIIKNAKLRAVLGWVIPFILIPGVIAAGIFIFKEKRYAFITLAVTVLSLLLFISGYERKKTGNRRMIIVAVMTAMAVVGRFIPVFKPIAAIALITGAYMGSECGFLVGALSAVISNMYFGQGPWTPFQMFAWGMVGFFAGLLSKPLCRSRILMLLYAAVSGIFYSLTLDIWAVLWYHEGSALKSYGAAIIAALPHTLAYTLSNMLFVLLLARPFGEKLQRVKIKYGI